MIRALLLQLLDQPLSAIGKLAQDPCTLDEVEIDGDKVKILRINDTSHLPYSVSRAEARRFIGCP